jgi:membrane protein DedA with SNARE-associated domain
VIAYGLPAIAILLLISGIGIPLPASLVVIAAGAFSQQEILDPAATAAVGLMAVTIGDSISYFIGRKSSHLLVPRFINKNAIDSARKSLEKYGGGLIIATRSILAALAAPTNIIAGSTGYPFTRFLLFDFVGELIWIIGYGSLGYLFGTEWEPVSDFLSNTGGFIAAIFLITFTGYSLWKTRKL